MNKIALQLFVAITYVGCQVTNTGDRKEEFQISLKVVEYVKAINSIYEIKPDSFCSLRDLVNSGLNT
ncbi:MAG: hypothetical protein GC181_07685 [Bacteroidetes bacterium]|nr:hypothetical protein [Bacteroidota bacterium]